MQAAALPKLSPFEYVSWCRDENNGLHKSKELGELTFSLQYKPCEYIVCIEQKKEHIEKSQLYKELEELQGLDYYDFRITLASGQGELLKHGLSSIQEYNERIDYFAFRMQHDIKLIAGKDTLGCQLFHFERSYDVSPEAVFLLGFPVSANANEERTFFYEDNIFRKGIIKFTFTPRELNQIPKLKTL
jgi:hypothetical protein